MEAPEVPLEQAQEHINEHAHQHSEGTGAPWVLGVALSSAILAALAAVASLNAGHHVNEAMISQIHASDQWAYYQAKGIKATVLASKIDLLEALGKPRDPQEEINAERYKKEQEEISEKAKEAEEESHRHLESHVGLARAVTMFQVSIAVAAISVLTRRRLFWFLSMGFGVIGIYFMARQLLGY